MKGRVDPESEAQMPWLNFELVSFMEQQKRGVVVEFGSGRSTVWLAKLGFYVLSIEHQENWATQVLTKLQTEGLSSRVKLSLVRADPQKPSDASLYLQPFLEYPTHDPFSFILVDGIFRNQCLEGSKPFVRKGTPVILHDSNRPEYRPAIDGLSLMPGIFPRTIYGPGYGTPDFTWATIFSQVSEATVLGSKSLGA